MKYKAFILKRNIEHLFIYPFVLLGRLIGRLQPLGGSYDFFYFFPFYHIGGAEKVHYQIAAATSGGRGIIFITKKSLNNLYYQQFAQAGCRLVDVSKYTDNKLLYFNNIIYRGIISYYINSQAKRPLVFNGQCNFGYKISPWIHPRVPQIELIHSLCSFSYIRIPYIKYFYQTVMISKKRIADHEALYDRYHIPQHYKERIVFILNGIQLPPSVKPQYNLNQPLKILYVGRDTEEKRVHLIATVSQRLQTLGIAVQMLFMGDVQHAIPAELHPFCTFLGNQNDDAAIHSIYLSADVLLMLSTTEGFPMAIMEAMARGLTVVSTAVGEIPYQLTTGENGFLIDNPADSHHVVDQAVEHLTTLANNRSMLAQMGANNIRHADTFYGLQRFAADYNQLFDRAKAAFKI